MFCKNCGNEVNEGAAFCPKCGAKIVIPSSMQENAVDPISNNTGFDNNSSSTQPESGVKQDASENKSTGGKALKIGLCSVAGLAAVGLIVWLAVNSNNSSSAALPASAVAPPAAEPAAAVAPAADAPEETAESSYNDTSTGNTANNDEGLTSTKFGEYTITVPSSYSLDSSGDEYVLFNDKDNNIIFIGIHPKSEVAMTGQWVRDHSDEAIDSLYDSFELSGEITNRITCNTGDFEGVGAIITEADGIELIAYMVNNSDSLGLRIIGKDNPLDVFELVDVIR